MKVIEILADSEKKLGEATKKSVKNIKFAFVQSQSVVMNDGEVSQFRVNLKVSFEVK